MTGKAASTRRLAACTESGALAPICAASSLARASRAPAATTSLTRPQASALAASIGWPVRIMCLVRPGPISRGRRWVPPQPGSAAMVTSGRPSRAALAIRMSAHSASSSPPPNAMPLRAAITGGGSAASRSNRAWPRKPQLRPNSSGVAPSTP